MSKDTNTQIQQSSTGFLKYSTLAILADYGLRTANSFFRFLPAQYNYVSDIIKTTWVLAVAKTLIDLEYHNQQEADLTPGFLSKVIKSIALFEYVKSQEVDLDNHILGDVQQDFSQEA
ncbi:MAG: hypothetical protein SFT93_00485 [Rickettsiaceae bacterium]|nr:hypothetical protein [Rickettsiaceae bacterium]